MIVASLSRLELLAQPNNERNQRIHSSSLRSSWFLTYGGVGEGVDALGLVVVVGGGVAQREVRLSECVHVSVGCGGGGGGGGGGGETAA